MQSIALSRIRPFGSFPSCFGEPVAEPRLLDWSSMFVLTCKAGMQCWSSIILELRFERYFFSTALCGIFALTKDFLNGSFSVNMADFGAIGLLFSSETGEGRSVASITGLRLVEMQESLPSDCGLVRFVK